MTKDPSVSSTPPEGPPIGCMMQNNIEYSLIGRCWRQAVLESCEDVVSIVKQWKAQLCSSVDPAICFIITGVLMVLHLHSIDAVNSDSVEFLARLRGHKDLLRLFVEQFASIWHLPRFLIGKYLTCKTWGPSIDRNVASYQKFSEVSSHPLSAKDIARVLSQLRGPLDQTWMKMHSLSSNDLKPPELVDFDMNIFSEADLGEWDSSWPVLPVLWYGHIWWYGDIR